MARRIIVQAGDTIAVIAERYLGNASLAVPLAKYNGISNPDLIFAGECLEIPTRAELSAATAPVAPPHTAITPPAGYDQIVSRFGNIRAYVKDDGHLSPHWESQHLVNAPLPFSVPLSWDRSQQVKNIYCHKLIADIVSQLFQKIQTEGLQNQIKTFGGCFNYRPKRQSAKFSTHCWGIAIDLNPETNQQGTQGDISQEVVTIFREHGFKWGGDWTGKSKDPMHFQFCTGY